MGEDANQEVPHFHIHLFGGRPLGRMVPRAE
jgi:diadenosine tetraphosphate (Ap4A) HIT family hydrolase